jgi:hypothetical protein
MVQEEKRQVRQDCFSDRTPSEFVMTMREKNEKTVGGSGTLEEGFSEAGALDRLKGYRSGLKTLQQATEAVAALRERVAGLEKRVSEL